MNDNVRHAIQSAVRRILRPLVRVLLRNGIACGECIEWLKQAYVEVAMQEFGLPGRKPNVSRAAVITGLTRKDVQRLVKQPDDDAAEIPVNRAERVISGWVRDSAFHDEDGEPRPLSREGPAGFAGLVRRYSGDMPPGTVLNELVRVGAVTEMEDGRVMLRARSYIPARDDLTKLHILGTDVAALMETIDHNLRHGSTNPRYQRKVRYDNIPLAHVERLRPEIATRCQHLLEDVGDLLAAHDRDVNPEVEGDGRGLVGIGIYYFEQTVQNGAEENE